MGWFSSLLMSVATGFSAFFLGTFAAIIYLLIYSSVTHRAVDYGMTYRRIGLPIGLLVLAASLAYLGTLWTRRQLRRK